MENKYTGKAGKIPCVAVILVHLEQETLTSECIESLRNITHPNFEIILVDNGSTNGSGFRLQKRFPDVHFIRSDVNTGFAGGNNIGIRAALETKADYIVLLNNDTVVDPGFLEPLIAYSSANHSVGVQGCKIYFYNPKDEIWFAGGFLKPHAGRGYHRGLHEVDRGQYNTIEETDFVTGCMMFMPVEVLRDVGVLDEQWFLYLEDVDWCMRARRKGYQIIYNPNAVIWHKTSSSTGHDSPVYLYYTMRNKILFVKKYSGVLHWGVRTPYFLFFYTRQIIRMSVKWRSRTGTRAIVAGLLDGLRGVTGRGSIDSLVQKPFPS